AAARAPAAPRGDPPRAAGLDLDALDLCVGVDARAGPLGTRHVGDQHRLLGVVAAAEDAVARLDAALAVVARHEARPTERLGPAADQPIERVDLVLADRLDLSALLDAPEAVLQLVPGPLRQPGCGSPHGDDRGRRGD